MLLQCMNWESISWHTLEESLTPIHQEQSPHNTVLKEFIESFKNKILLQAIGKHIQTNHNAVDQTLVNKNTTQSVTYSKE